MRHFCWLLVATATIWLGLEGQALAATSYDDTSTPEGWAWAQIKQGREANLNERCNEATLALDPRAQDETRWADRCRRLPASFLVDILTLSPWREQVPIAGVVIVGAQIEGDINLRNARLNRGLVIKQCRIENSVNLVAARTDDVIEIAGSQISGAFSAQRFHSERSVTLRNSEFKQPVSLVGAMIDGHIDMDGAAFDENLNANALQVGVLFMRSNDRNQAAFKAVDLINARVTGNVEMDGTTFDGDLNASGLQVGGNLFMRSNDQNKAMFKKMNLTGARVTGNVEMSGAIVDGDLSADGLQVGAYLFLRSMDQHKATFKGVLLRNARITGTVEMTGATFDGDLIADGLHVGGDLLMKSVNQDKATFEGVRLSNARITRTVEMDGATFNGELIADGLQVGAYLSMRDVIGNERLNMVFVQTGGNLELRGATLTELDLSGASVAGDLRLGGGRWRDAKDSPVKLTLRNARVANLMDARDAWPTRGHIHIDGFTFARLGGFAGDTGPIMRGRGMEWWDDWARRDPEYTPTPYEQLAAALVAAGDRSAADDIRFLGRVRQRETEKGWSWVLSGFLQYVAGFGIGDYTFRVVGWVAGIAAAGALYLWACVPRAKAHGPIWCFGASLSRLLPVIEINKEFSDFFNDPKRRRLTGTQSFVFSVVGMTGWVLGAILVAAVSGLTQKP